MLLHFLDLTKLACHCHVPSSTELWAAIRLDHGPPLECCCMACKDAQEDRNGQASDINI